ncbi:hypothetical protein [Sphingobacterium bovisgrunnientis]|nr:hypothetical protein [Sphingobacterium bovisgrunnientis]
MEYGTLSANHHLLIGSLSIKSTASVYFGDAGSSSIMVKVC